MFTSEHHYYYYITLTNAGVMRGLVHNLTSCTRLCIMGIAHLPRVEGVTGSSLATPAGLRG